MRNKHISFLSIVGVLFFIGILYCACDGSDSNPDKNSSDKPLWRKNHPILGSKGKDYRDLVLLSKKHCSGCHTYVPPDMLDRITWSRVLNQMKYQMDKQSYLIEKEEWIKVQQFYLNNSPPVFYSTTKKNLPELQSTFIEKNIETPSNTKNTFTLLKYIASDSTLYLGNKEGIIYQYEQNELDSLFTSQNIPVDLVSANQSLLLLGIGSLKPSEQRTGQLLKIGTHKEESIIVDSLKRPINVQVASLNAAEQSAYIISSFGSTIDTILSGKLSIFNSHTLEEIIIDPLSGATQSAVVDLENDGINEIIALFSQGNESINIYKKTKEEKFDKKTAISFPPVFGTNSFDLADINEDGFLDIIVTSGDNDDYSKIVKPYHGVRIYINDQSNNFKEQFFYAINGASKVKCADFDQDGDMDFVVIAMYADLFSRPYESLLIFENRGNNHFEPQYFTQQPVANWVLLELADMDNDGDMDIITAANNEIVGFVPPKLMQDWNETKVAFQIWYNQVGE